MKAINMKNEIWLPVEGYEGLYEVSNEGRVRSLNYNKTGETKILKPEESKGYLRVKLCKNRKVKRFLVHQLVAQAFVPNIFNLDVVNHINEVKSDNRAENLMWVTQKENCNWGTRNKRVFEKTTNGKLSKTVYQFSKDGEFIREWPSTKEVERVLGYFHTNISSCCLGKRKSANGFVWQYK